jgi:hypothetical protein
MTIRTISKTVTFNRPFRLDGLNEPQPAGDYEIETDEELMESMSFIGYRRVTTVIHLRPRADQPGIRQELTIDPVQLDIALATDQRIEVKPLPLSSVS